MKKECLHFEKIFLHFWYYVHFFGWLFKGCLKNI